jgi:hypothetical protein
MHQACAAARGEFTTRRRRPEQQRQMTDGLAPLKLATCRTELTSGLARAGCALAWPDLGDIVVLREGRELGVVLLHALAVRLARAFRQPRRLACRRVYLVLPLRLRPASRGLWSRVRRRAGEMCTGPRLGLRCD